MMYKLNVIDANDQMIEAVLDGTKFFINLVWNESDKSFIINLHDSNSEIILAGVKVVPNYPLFFQSRASFMPLGDIVVGLSPVINRIERSSFEDGLAELFYFPEDELEAMGLLDKYGKI